MWWLQRLAISAATLFLLLIAGQFSPTPSNTAAASLKGCSDVVEQLLEEENSFEALVNPQLKTKSEVEDRLIFYQELGGCLYLLEGAVPSEDLDLLDFLARRFVLLVGGLNQPPELIDLATDNDPAVARLRKEVGLPPPEGFVYLNQVSTRDEVLPDLTTAFLNPSTVGVTLLSRYVIVLEEKNLESSERELQKKTLPQTISHELIHVYLYAVLGADYDALPDWFHEGLAIHLSGSGKEQSTYTQVFVPGGIAYQEISRVEPEEYQGYKTTFEYLESTLGEEVFNQTVKQTVMSNSVEAIFSETGMATYPTLEEKAKEWKKDKDKAATQKRLMIIGAVILGVLVVGYFVMPKGGGYREPTL